LKIVEDVKEVTTPIVENTFTPTQQEIEDYAEYLGMDISTDTDLIYIAEEGVKAMTPEPWVIEETKDGVIQYRNKDTGEINLDHPLDAVYRRKY